MNTSILCIIMWCCTHAHAKIWTCARCGHVHGFVQSKHMRSLRTEWMHSDSVHIRTHTFCPILLCSVSHTSRPAAPLFAFFPMCRQDRTSQPSDFAKSDISVNCLRRPIWRNRMSETFHLKSDNHLWFRIRRLRISRKSGKKTVCRQDLDTNSSGVMATNYLCTHYVLIVQKLVV